MEVDKLAFFSRISAGLTHELKNVLATIRECNGLMGDLLAAAKESPFPHRENILRCIGKIEFQVERGVNLTTDFNRFAHSVDNETARVDLKEMVRQTVALVERFARLKRIELKSEVSEDAVPVLTSPFQLHMALAEAVEAFTENMPGTGTVTLRVREDKDRPAVDLICETRPEEWTDMREAIMESAAWWKFEQRASMLQMEVRWRQGPEGGITLLMERG